MKLTKAQRLFVEVGKAQASMEYYKWRENQSLFDDEDDDGVILVTDIAKYRKLRKKLIREALWAYEEELIRAFYDGVSSVRKESDDSPMVIEEDGQNIII